MCDSLLLLIFGKDFFSYSNIAISTCRLWIHTRDGNQDNLEGITLTRSVFMQQIDNLLRCKIICPVKGRYKFKLYGEKSGPETNSENMRVSDKKRSVTVRFHFFRIREMKQGSSTGTRQIKIPADKSDFFEKNWWMLKCTNYRPRQVDSDEN